jgi:hypothetical protein
VDGAEVTTLTRGPVAAVLSEVPASRFDEQAIRSNLEDLDWLSDTAQAHHRVIDAIARVTAVAPLRMATLVRDPVSVGELLEANRDAFTKVLDRVRGRQEWGVKVYLADADAGGDDVPERATAGPGTAYLLRKRGQRDRARRALAAGEERARLLHELLAGHAEEARTYPPQDPRLSGRPEPMVLNAAYLVPEARVDTLREALAGFDATGLRVDLTGPWAPYSFTQDSAS